MITRGSIRRKSAEIFKQVITLRKQGHSYTEIRKATCVAKSTINNWITFAGLNLSPEHMQIQTRKRMENHTVGTEASKRTRAKRKEEDIQEFISKQKVNFDNPLYNFGVALYESEGSKSTYCKFSNSDFRLIQMFVCFIEKYFSINRDENMSFDLYLHITRKPDLGKIKGFWANKIQVPASKIRVYWKRNKIVGRKENQDYVGQIMVSVHGVKVLGSKLHAISDIILRKHLRLY
jgi:hypothetical protein